MKKVIASLLLAGLTSCYTPRTQIPINIEQPYLTQKDHTILDSVVKKIANNRLVYVSAKGSSIDDFTDYFLERFRDNEFKNLRLPQIQFEKSLIIDGIPLDDEWENFELDGELSHSKTPRILRAIESSKNSKDLEKLIVKANKLGFKVRGYGVPQEELDFLREREIDEAYDDCSKRTYFRESINKDIPNNKLLIYGGTKECCVTDWFFFYKKQQKLTIVKPSKELNEKARKEIQSLLKLKSIDSILSYRLFDPNKLHGIHTLDKQKNVETYVLLPPNNNSAPFDNNISSSLLPEGN